VDISRRKSKRIQILIGNVLLRKLLQILCCGRPFLDVDSLYLQVGDPQLRKDKNLQNLRSLNYEGLVLPCHVSMDNQSSAEATKNYWTIAVVNWQDKTFTAFGMEKELSEIWRLTLQEYLKDILVCDIELVSVSMEVSTLLVSLSATILTLPS
jgi:hypothetical protein